MILQVYEVLFNGKPRVFNSVRKRLTPCTRQRHATGGEGIDGATAVARVRTPPDGRRACAAIADEVGTNFEGRRDGGNDAPESVNSYQSRTLARNGNGHVTRSI